MKKNHEKKIKYNCDKIQILTKHKTEIVTKLKNWNCDNSKTKTLTNQKNSNFDQTEIVTKLNYSNCVKTQWKLWQSS